MVSLASSSTVCPRGWIQADDTCFMLHTNYNASNLPDFTYDMAESVCAASHSHVSVLDTRMFDVVKTYLRLWRHTPATGDIWLSRQRQRRGHCRSIRVRQAQCRWWCCKYRLCKVTRHIWFNKG